MLKSTVISLLLAASFVEAQQSTSATATATATRATSSSTGSSSAQPCAQVSASIASYLSANPSATANPQLPYSLVKQCAQSVPLDPDDASVLVEGLMAFLEYQSDLAYKAKPPPGYLMAGVDIMAELQAIKNAVDNGTLKSEFDFERQVQLVYARAHDGHLAFRPDGLSIISLQRPLNSLVSLSWDGVETPKIYIYSNVIAYLQGNGTKPLAVTKINGVDASTFIQYETQNTTIGGYQDPDALYNDFFFQFNNGAAGITNWNGRAYGASGNDPGANTSVVYEDGSTDSGDNHGYVAGNFSGVVDGNSFYQKFLNYTVKEQAISASRASQSMLATATATRTASSTASATSTISQIRGYPLPVVISSDGTASGYFLNQPGFQDTAVLALRSMSEGAASSFQATVTKFLSSCRSANKTRLILDLQGNSGGTIGLGYDVMKQLFPTVDPYGAFEYRAHRDFRLLGQALTPLAQSILQQNPNNFTLLNTNAFVPQTYLNASTGLPYTTFDSYYGPFVAPNGYGNYTNLARNNMSNPNYNEAVAAIVPSGYANNTNVAPQPFAAENIIILSDGRCSSTCTILGHFLKWQGKIKSIAIGGRPTKSPMQSIGGIKGSEVYTLASLTELISEAYYLLNTTITNTWNGTSLDTINKYANYVSLRSASAGAEPAEISVNYQNNIAEGDASRTPLQYVYEAADCRMYFTPPHILNITNMWLDVAANAFGLNGTKVFGKCVAGSTNQPSSLSGNSSLYNGGKISNSSVSGPNVPQGQNSSVKSSQQSASQNAGSKLSMSLSAGLITMMVAAML